jgi:SAM-dependent methyltransferase
MGGLVERPGGWFTFEPKPTAEALAAYYNDKYFGPGHGGQYAHGYTDEELEHKGLAAAEAERVWGRGPGRLLEVGVGEGFFLDGFARRGWEVQGVDFTDDGLKAFFPELRDRVRIGDAFALLDSLIAREEQFDLVACNNVIEHVLDPEGLLQRLRRIVAKDGLLRIAAPNDGSWLQREIVGRGLAAPDFWVALPDHLNYFDADSLPRVLQMNGWSVAELLGEFPIDLFLLNSEAAYLGAPAKGRAAHFARVAFETSLWRRRSVEGVLAFRRGCAEAGVGRNLIAYARPA